MNRNNEDNAVSPAIATILIVLMTVIAAAAAAVVVMGMADTQPDYVVGLIVKAAPAGADAVVTLYGSRDIPGLVRLEVIDAGSSSGAFVEAWNGAAGTAPVGVPLTAKGVARPAEEMPSYATNVWVKGTFADGTDQVLLMQAVTFTNGELAGSDVGDEYVGPGYTIIAQEWSEYYNANKWSISLPKDTLLQFHDGYVFVTSQYSYDPHWLNVDDINTLNAQDFLQKSLGTHSGFVLDLSEEKISNAQEVDSLPSSPSDEVGTLVKYGDKLYAKVRFDAGNKNDWVVVGTKTT